MELNELTGKNLPMAQVGLALMDDGKLVLSFYETMDKEPFFVHELNSICADEIHSAAESTLDAVHLQMVDFLIPKFLDCLKMQFGIK